MVIHEPELEAGARDSKGRSVLKPLKRKEAKFSVSATAIIGGLVLLCVAVAWLVGREYSEQGPPTFILAVGAVLLGPPLAYAGYSFLRDDESGYYQGADVLLRSLACGLVYALLWGVFMWVGWQVFGDDVFESKDGLGMVSLVGLTVPILLVGAGAAFVAFDLDMLTGGMHYALYFVVTVGLRWVMGLALLPGLVLGG